MTAKIEFFYTHGHSYTATNVDENSILQDENIVEYVSRTEKESLDIESTNLVTVQKHDLKFAIVTYSEDSVYAGNTCIIHGLVGKFDIMASFAEADKIRKIEAEDRLAAERIAYKRQREAEKYVERRKKRAAERKKELVKEEAELVKAAKAAQKAAH